VRIGIVGGSISGCIAGVELARSGHSVEVFERSPGRLVEQGAGIGLLAQTLNTLIDRDLIDADAPRLEVQCQIFGAKHPSDARFGREALRWPTSSVSMNWAGLHRNLRARVPDSMYRAGMRVEVVTQHAGDRAVLRFADGREERFDLVVFADGYQSLGRALICPEATRSYRGYVLWRGIVEECAIPDIAPLRGAIHSIGYRGLRGNAAVYRMPRASAEKISDEGVVNFACYLPLAEQELPRFLVDREGREHATSLPPGGMRLEEETRLKALLRQHVPSYFADVFDLARDTFAQPIYRVQMPRHRSGRLCAIGDAGALLPPFTGSGVMKAAMNAIDLAKRLAKDDDVDAALTKWDANQTRLGNTLFALSEQMERAVIWEMPDLATLDQEAAAIWWRNATSVPVSTG
jgi:2-polyprenyl-6-methoxyphenol hydroxylase-like FAD-dependent oxidoreductase